MYYIEHNITDWQYECVHLTKIERCIFLELRSLYFYECMLSINIVEDIEYLARRLLCNTEEEINSLIYVIKDRFTKGKDGLFFREDWNEKIKKFLKNQKNSAKTRNGNSNVKVTETVTASNEKSKAKTEAERQKKLRNARNDLKKELALIGVETSGTNEMEKLRKLHDENIVAIRNAKQALKSNNDSNTITKTVTASNEKSNAENGGYIINNHITNNHINNNQINNNKKTERENNLSHSEKIFKTNQKAVQNDIDSWQAPSLDDIRSLIMDIVDLETMKGIQLKDQEQYDRHIKKFKNHYRQKAMEGKPLLDEELRKDKLVEWIIREKPIQWNSNQQPTLNPKNSIICNGISKPCFPNMDTRQSYEYVTSQRLAGETLDETYERIAKSMQNLQVT